MNSDYVYSRRIKVEEVKVDIHKLRKGRVTGRRSLGGFLEEHRQGRYGVAY